MPERKNPVREEAPDIAGAGMSGARPMFTLVSCLVGCVVGWVRAGRRGGTAADKAQYAVAHGAAFGLTAMALGVAAHWSGLFSGL